MDSKMVRHYETVKGEATRLSQGSHRVEFERTKEILLRDLPPPSAQILDLAGGAGVYSFWLADKSYKVHLVDIVPLHVEQAKAADSDSILASICQGDARCLDFEFDSMGRGAIARAALSSSGAIGSNSSTESNSSSLKKGRLGFLCYHIEVRAPSWWIEKRIVVCPRVS